MFRSAAALAALACAGRSLAALFTLSETYDASNFADKFGFFTAPDPNNGFVSYLSQEQATQQGLFAIRDNQVYLGVDHTTVLPADGTARGRSSLRLESSRTFRHGLIVARFTHLPARRCGSWPAVWTVGADWPNGGEMDVYEGWNGNSHNQPALHTGPSSRLGPCRLSGAGQSAVVVAPDCDNSHQDAVPGQYAGQGCTAAEPNGAPWASAEGGTLAIEWTSAYVKFFSFARAAEPGDVASDRVDTATWGLPSVFLAGGECDIDGHFSDQRIVLDMAFCGNPPGRDSFWRRGCADRTGYATCAAYVAGAPGDFAESYFQIRDIRYFEETNGN